MNDLSIPFHEEAAHREYQNALARNERTAGNFDAARKLYVEQTISELLEDPALMFVEAYSSLDDEAVNAFKTMCDAGGIPVEKFIAAQCIVNDAIMTYARQAAERAADVDWPRWEPDNREVA